MTNKIAQAVTYFLVFTFSCALLSLSLLQRHKINQLQINCSEDTIIVKEYYHDTVFVYEQIEDLYDTVVSFIKEHEGYVSSIYEDINGNLTIGHGHLIKRKETFTHKTILSPLQAHRLLEKDLDRCLYLLDQKVSLKGSKRLSMGHFIYCKGIGTFVREILPVIDDTEEVCNRILLMKYRRNREFEVWLWKR